VRRLLLAPAGVEGPLLGQVAVMNAAPEYFERAAEGWGSVAGGKWHRTVNAEPSFYGKERSLCGLTFNPR